MAGRYRSLYIWFKTRTNNQDKSIIKVSRTSPETQSKVRKSLYVFPCSLDSFEIPPATAKWRAAIDDLPRVDGKMFTQYVSKKRVVSTGQQKKALQMFTSRKIVNVKTLADGQEVYVKATIKKTYGSMQRPTVMFENGIPSKAHCSCPVGLSGICFHVLALLLFLKHYHETGERILALTSTEQLQKWHRCSHKSSIPMVPLREFNKS